MMQGQSLVEKELAAIRSKQGAAVPPNPSGPKPRGFRTPEQITRENAADVGAAKDAEDNPSGAARALGTVASLVKDIPGAEMAQAGLSSLANGIPYRSALEQIKGAEDAAPAYTRIPARLAGSTVALMATPGSAATAGGRIGALEGLLQSDPDADTSQRLRSGAGRGLMGAAAGKVAEIGSTALRSKLAAPLGTTAIEKRGEIALADAPAYGAVRSEVAGGGTHPAIQNAFDQPDIKPAVDFVKSLREFQGADDGTIAVEAYKHLGKVEQQLALKEAQGNLTSVDMAIQRNMGRAKAELMYAIKQIAPSFPAAVEQHATQMGERNALSRGVDATKRLLGNAVPAGDKLELRSPEAFEQAVGEMTPKEAAMATQGVLGTAKQNIGLNIHPFQLFGAMPTTNALLKTPRFLEATDKAAGNQTPEMAQKAFLALLNSLGSRP